MDFIGLTNDFLIETGIGDPVSSLVDANEDVVRAAHWIDNSWASFQRERLWPFRKAEKSLTVTAGMTSSVPAARSMSSGDIILPDSFWSNGSINCVSYESLRTMRRSGNNVDTTKLSAVSVNDGTIQFYPAPSVPLAIEFDYWKAVQRLVNNGDTPEGLPADFHSLIVHLAVARYGVVAGGNEGSNLYQHHAREYVKVLSEYELFLGVSPSGSSMAVKRTLL